jgi:hypothetical protein
VSCNDDENADDLVKNLKNEWSRNIFLQEICVPTAYSFQDLVRKFTQQHQ